MTRLIDLHELADRKGYGAARNALIEAGQWDEYAGLPFVKFKVRYEFQVQEEGSEVVEARCADEAQDKLQDLLNDKHDADVDIIACEAKEIPE